MTYEQIKTCQEIKQHLKMPRSAVREAAKDYLEQNGEESPVITLELERLDRPIRFAVTKKAAGLNQLIVFDTFKKSALYSESKDFLDNFDLDFVSFYTKSLMLAVSRDKFYRGLGGLFVMESENEELGIIIEPLKYFLKRKFPLREEQE